MQIVSQVENAMVAALKAAATAFRIDTIESYGGQLDDDLLEWVRRLPALWVVFGGAAKPTRVATHRRKWRYQGTFTVFAAQRNLAGNKALRQGDANNPGLYALMQIAHQALLARDLALPISPFEPGEVRLVTSFVANRDAVMAYALNWHTEWVVEAAEPDLVPPGELHTLGLQYFLQPGDATADAADVLAIPVP